MTLSRAQDTVIQHVDEDSGAMNDIPPRIIAAIRSARIVSEWEPLLSTAEARAIDWMIRIVQ